MIKFANFCCIPLPDISKYMERMHTVLLCDVIGFQF